MCEPFHITLPNASRRMKFPEELPHSKEHILLGMNYNARLDLSHKGIREANINKSIPHKSTSLIDNSIKYFKFNQLSFN